MSLTPSLIFVYLLREPDGTRNLWQADPIHFPQKKTSRNFVSQKNLAETTVSQINISRNVHLPEITFPRKLSFQKFH